MCIHWLPRPRIPGAFGGVSGFDHYGPVGGRTSLASQTPQGKIQCQNYPGFFCQWHTDQQPWSCAESGRQASIPSLAKSVRQAEARLVVCSMAPKGIKANMGPIATTATCRPERELSSAQDGLIRLRRKRWSRDSPHGNPILAGMRGGLAAKRHAGRWQWQPAASRRQRRWERETW